MSGYYVGTTDEPVPVLYDSVRAAEHSAEGWSPVGAHHVLVPSRRIVYRVEDEAVPAAVLGPRKWAGRINLPRIAQALQDRDPRWDRLYRIDDLLTVKMVTDWLGIQERTWWRWKEQHGLPDPVFPKPTVYLRPEVISWAREHGKL